MKLQQKKKVAMLEVKLDVIWRFENERAEQS